MNSQTSQISLKFLLYSIYLQYTLHKICYSLEYNQTYTGKVRLLLLKYVHNIYMCPTLVLTLNDCEVPKLCVEAKLVYVHFRCDS